jgi:DNA-binding transcriptional MocR family regulator
VGAQKEQLSGKRFHQELRIQLNAISRYFPEGTHISRPAGGPLLWIEMAPKIDALRLYQAALAERIAILPGRIFTVSNRFRNCIRINCGLPSK